ncbi:hypothetical protein [Actinoplanes sp. NBRC 101535]|uniref:hypothetical protein n=1 Tax=Actinoplanes sp. NBRC 101535 TaxID=3032196 RepID=UPI0024A3DD03|nr:hypothetical protein [Actinoplanes sp. NBRC 101535]GLY07959.1 hypothetical protein Acsp01_83380 [Actinoplanes sp. NBRC 101535]
MSEVEFVTAHPDGCGGAHSAVPDSLGFAAIETPGDMRRRHLSPLLDGLDPPRAQPLP